MVHEHVLYGKLLSHKFTFGALLTFHDAIYLSANNVMLLEMLMCIFVFLNKFIYLKFGELWNDKLKYFEFGFHVHLRPPVDAGFLPLEHIWSNSYQFSFIFVHFMAIHHRTHLGTLFLPMKMRPWESQQELQLVIHEISEAIITLGLQLVLR